MPWNMASSYLHLREMEITWYVHRTTQISCCPLISSATDYQGYMNKYSRLIHCSWARWKDLCYQGLVTRSPNFVSFLDYSVHPDACSLHQLLAKESYCMSNKTHAISKNTSPSRPIERRSLTRYVGPHHSAKLLQGLIRCVRISGY